MYARPVHGLWYIVHVILIIKTEKLHHMLTVVEKILEELDSQ